MKKQIKEASDVQSKSDEKLSHALQNLRMLQDEKNSLEAKLGQKQAALQAQVRRSRREPTQALKRKNNVYYFRLKLYIKKLRKSKTCTRR